MGMPPRLDVDEEIRALRAILAKAVGSEAAADLAIWTAVFGENQREVSERLGISHDAARKRVPQAIKRLKEALEKK